MKKIILLTLLSSFGLSALIACGPSITDVASPELGLVAGSDEFNLENIGPRDRDRTLSSLEIENVGPGTMTINRLEWVARPDRLHAFHTGDRSTEAGMCSVDADCGADAFCITASGSCRDLGFRPTPIQVESQRRYSISFVILQGNNPVQCPAPHDDVPERVRRNYCGELLIETDATNTSPGVEDGKARIYFLSDGSSGLMALSDEFLRFTEVVPGGTYTRSFSINNQAGGALTVEQANFTQNPSWFSISPNLANTVIEGNGSMAFTLEMTIPSDVGPEALEFGSTVAFQSSSTGTNPSIFVDVTAGPGDVPLIEVTPQQLSFAEQSSQTVEIQNHGGATLVVTGLDIVPEEAKQFYTVSYEGAEINLGSGSVPNLPPASNEGPTVRELLIEFTPPTDPGVSTVASLEIRHSDSRSESPLRIQLLGDNQEVALGEIGNTATRQVRFISDGGEQVRRLPLSNRGNADLVITGLDLDDSPSNTNRDDYTFEVYQGGELTDIEGLIVPPGGIREVVISYVGASQFAQNLGVSILSNHAGQVSSMSLNVSAQSGSLSGLIAGITPSFSTTALVGQSTTFQLTLSGEGETATSATNAIWTTLSRPDGSEALLQSVGGQSSFVPDRAGTYRVAVQVRDNQNREVQEILEFEATE